MVGRVIVRVVGRAIVGWRGALLAGGGVVDAGGEEDGAVALLAEEEEVGAVDDELDGLGGLFVYDAAYADFRYGYGGGLGAVFVDLECHFLSDVGDVGGRGGKE